MNRRAFLRFCGVVAASAYAPRMAIGGQEFLVDEPQSFNFDPMVPSEGYVVLNCEDEFRASPAVRRIVFQAIEGEMRREVPPEYRYKVRYFLEGPVPTAYDPLVELTYLRWIYTP